MSWLDAVILGMVQGFTEFFPVSSSGHLVLGQAVLGVQVPGIVFDVAVHVATLISVLFVYRARVAQLAAGALRRDGTGTGSYLLKLALATVPAGVVGVAFQDWFEARFDDPVFAATMILVTGCFVWSTRWALGTKRFGPLELLPLLVAAAFSFLGETLLPFLIVAALQLALLAAARFLAPPGGRAMEPSWTGATIMGVAQAIAIFPGISRSGSTVVSGLWHRIDPVAAAEFSFLMSVPAILGAAALQVPDAMGAPLGISPAALALGFIAAAVSGIVAIRFFVALLRRQNFYVFAYYCWAVGGIFLLATT